MIELEVRIQCWFNNSKAYIKQQGILCLLVFPQPNSTPVQGGCLNLFWTGMCGALSPVCTHDKLA